uniref:Reverse transcriptase zinc-binding domain-containing protein n=1 Tax=Nelumbo nucifera TaxID=4432 RepID=A0A822Y9M6_NELNU|nr:TPA_asm: hypothetical protein HUJ06_027756 [Nelumbo nucifera]
MEDQLVWTLTPDGQFTTSSAYRLLVSEQPSSSNASVLFEGCEWENFWKFKWVCPTIMIFIWRALNAAIPTRNRLKKWIPNFDSSCPLCGTEGESVDHLFLNCSIGKAVWFGSELGVRSDRFKHFPDLISSWISLSPPVLSNPFQSYPLAFSLIWHPWLARNLAIFRGISWSPELIIEKA